MPEKAMAPHSSTLAWRIPWMEAQEPVEGSLERGLLSDMGTKQPSKTSGIEASPGP